MKRSGNGGESADYWAARVAVIALRAAVGGYVEALPTAVLSIDGGTTTVTSHEAAVWLLGLTKPAEMLAERVGDFAILRRTDGESLKDPGYRAIRRELQAEIWQEYAETLGVRAPTDELRVIGGGEEIVVPGEAFETYLRDYQLAVGHAMTARPPDIAPDSRNAMGYVRFVGRGGSVVAAIESDDQ